MLIRKFPIDNTFQLNSVAEYGAGISSHDDYLEILSFRKKHRVGLKVVGEGQYYSEKKCAGIGCENDPNRDQVS